MTTIGGMSDTPASGPPITLPAQPQPDSVYATVSEDPAPGWKSSEAWLTLLAVILGAIPNSGLVADSPLAAKLVGMAIAALAAVGYTTNRTSLKRAHVTANAGWVTPSSATKAQPWASTTLVALGAALVAFIVILGCCTTGQKTAVTNGANAFLQCGKQDLTQIIKGQGNQNQTLLQAVAEDLVSQDFEKAIADLITRLGNDAVGCAVLAVDTVVEAGKTSGAAALSPIEVRARELIDKYNWKLGLPTGPQK